MLFIQALRPLDDNQAQVCSLIIQLLLLKHPDFRNRVQEFVKEVSGRKSELLNYIIFFKTFPVWGGFVTSESDDTSQVPSLEGLQVFKWSQTDKRCIETDHKKLSKPCLAL